jgi:acyl carrier protein
MDYKKECIKIIAEKLGVEESKVSSNQFLSKDLGADSLDIVEIIMEVECVFNIKIEDTFTMEDRTVGEVANLVEKLVDEKR